MATPESEAIPYEPLDLQGERLLVLAPHPDDEVIGCGGLIARHLVAGRQVRIVVVTDGAEAGDPAVREEESRRALAHLGDVVPEFLRFRDRHLDEERDALSHRIRELLSEFKPDLIAVPSPVEIHPDHFALARAFCELVQRDDSLFAELAVARVAFYEIGAPMRPNALVDISAVADEKYASIALHESQLRARDYVSYSRGLNAYRAMTLSPGTRYAEAYWVTPLPALHTTPLSILRAAVGAPRGITVEREAVPISVIVRTKDRPALLREAIDSIRGTGYPAEVIVVNDGGATPEAAGATVINHSKSKGRSEAMNSGVRAAKSPLLAFLDDDDLYYPEHLSTLANAARSSQHAAWYSDAVGASGAYETHSRMRIFGSDFDRDQLLIDNYIPLPTVLLPRETYLDLGGFDAAFDLFEDWDFLIRLSQRGAFVHVPRITCEIRHIEGAGSITLESPEGSKRFRDAKLQIWRKHSDRINDDLIANVVERYKRRLMSIHGDLVELTGLRHRHEVEIARMQRELEAADHRSNQLHGANAEIRGALEAADAERYRLRELQPALEESERTNAALFAEVGRLQTLLDTIFKSRTWKLHTIVDRLRGNG
jgi:LmbE family N-acetylglucosaminyl deacetylase/glycosyltransferase involved in cell wall biosynthesis